MNKARFKKDTIVVLSTLYKWPQLALVRRDLGKKGIWVRTYLKDSHRWTKQSRKISHEEIKDVVWVWPNRRVF